jgi:hypothetical protein
MFPGYEKSVLKDVLEMVIGVVKRLIYIWEVPG